MSDVRKKAYRRLLYFALLEARGLDSVRWWWFFNPFGWPRFLKRIRRVGAIGGAFHNLALFASQDFRGFNEERFWHDVAWLDKHYSSFNWRRYREQFDQDVNFSVH